MRDFVAGYRNAPAYIKNAAHVPPRDAVREVMTVLFDLIAKTQCATDWHVARAQSHGSRAPNGRQRR